MQVGDLVRLSAIEEVKLINDLGIPREEAVSDWEYGIVIEVCTNHGNPPFYQVHWSPANEVIEESNQSIIKVDN